jgi:UDP-hydrolysing UDP-N-acetyl-D-glucosamine 2-epimerase
MIRRRICVITTSRADYGLLYWLMKEIDRDPDLTLQVAATGLHLSPELGLTVRAIHRDGLKISRQVEMLLGSDTATGAVKSIGVGLIAFADTLKDLHPQMIVLLGDRYELLAVAIAALLLRIPVAHIHGGETSQGAVDEAVRHAVTKMAALHFPATEAYRRRIIQMGEDPARVFNFGAPGLDTLYRIRMMDRKELQDHLGFDLTGRVALVTYHPVTLEKDNARAQIKNVLIAIQKSGLKAVFTKANGDPQGLLINRAVKTFCDRNPSRFRLYDNLGQKAYLSVLKNLYLMIGNSSSGLTEAPSFGLPVVNIGDRQKGRMKAKNVIDVGYGVGEIVRGIQAACSDEFRERIQGIQNPYDRFRDGKTSFRIKEILKKIELSPDLLKKKFNDLTQVESS